jgi:AraC family transcriptional regulator, transcriptional activator of pobA
MKHFKSLTEMHRHFGFPPPAHPLLSLHHCANSCALGESEFTGDFYMIGFKKLLSGQILYGRTTYDHENGSLYFIKPRQVIEFKDLTFEQDGFLIYVHEDFLNGHFLHEEIKKYHYFDYETNEALHVSPREEEILWDLYRRIAHEYDDNPDEYSRDIMLTHIDSILKYAQRFYKRQFIGRAELSGKTVSKFNRALTEYKGQNLPTVNYLAEKLNISPRYLSDLLKQETGKTAIELIHIHLITEAKHLLKTADQSVAEIAYRLGFENLPYFSRLFKKETGQSPNTFKKHQLN